MSQFQVEDAVARVSSMMPADCECMDLIHWSPEKAVQGSLNNKLLVSLFILDRSRSFYQTCVVNLNCYHGFPFFRCFKAGTVQGKRNDNRKGNACVITRVRLDPGVPKSHRLQLHPDVGQSHGQYIRHTWKVRAGDILWAAPRAQISTPILLEQLSDVIQHSLSNLTRAL